MPNPTNFICGVLCLKRDVKPVYLIVIFENSPKEFKNFDNETYFHHVTPISDTGIELNLLYNFYFISLVIYTARM